MQQTTAAFGTRGIRDAGGNAIFVKANVANEDEVKQLVGAALDAFGHLDVLYNNVGIMPSDDGSVTDITEAIWDKIMDVNLKSAFLCCKYIIPHMVKQGKGSIINVASFVAFVGCTVPQDAYTPRDAQRDKLKQIMKQKATIDATR